MVGASTPSNPPGYNAFFSTPIPGQGHNGGSAIFVRRDIPTVPIQITSSLQAVAVKIYIDKFYTVCSLYLPPVDPVTKGDLTGLIRDLPDPFVLLGDFSGRHPLWDEGATNARGILLLLLLRMRVLKF